MQKRGEKGHLQMLVFFNKFLDIFDFEVLVAAVLLQAISLLVIYYQIYFQIAQFCQLITFFDEIFLPLAFNSLPSSCINYQCLFHFLSI